MWVCLNSWIYNDVMSSLCMSSAALFYRAMLNAHIFKLLLLNFAFFTSGHFKNKDKEFFTNSSCRKILGHALISWLTPLKQYHIQKCLFPYSNKC